MKKARLVVDHVVKWFDQGGARTTVLNGVYGSFFEGKRYAITGSSGAGKSTLIHILAGVDSPTTGAVFYNDTPVHRFSSDKKNSFLNKSIGLVFQFPYLIRELSVVENVMIPGLIAEKTYETCLDRALYLLEHVGIAEKAHRPPLSLSGGQQQRVSLARALFNEPSFLLADEPTGNLDVETGKDILRLILMCHEKQGMGVIVNTHDEYIANAMDEIYVLQSGKLVQVDKAD